MPQKFVNLENLTSFWGNAKEYIGNERKEIEDQLYNWQKTEKAPVVQCEPVPNSELHPTVEFKFKETLPEGEKGSNNPSTISGVSNITVGRVGKNLLTSTNTTPNNYTITRNTDGSLFISGSGAAMIAVTDGGFGVVGPYSVVYLDLNTVYTLSVEVVSGSFTGSSVNLAQSNSTQTVIQIPSSGKASMTFKPIDRGFTNGNFVCRILTGGSSVADNCILKIQLEKGSIATNFDAPISYSNVNSIINLNNTYYGGFIDLSTGLMTVTQVGYELDSSLTWNTSSVDYVYRTIKKAAKLITDQNYGAIIPLFKSSHYTITMNSAASMPLNSFYARTDGNIIINTGNLSMQDFKDWLDAQKLAGTPVVITYPLAVPQTVQLTPQQIKSLVSLEGTSKRINTLYTDADSIQVEYQKYVGVDSTLDNTSENAIQNKVVNSALNTKVSLTGDEVIAGSKTFSSPINGSVTGDAGTVAGHIVSKDVPVNAAFTDTTYEPATQSTAGLMSASDKVKLDAVGSVFTFKGSVVNSSSLPVSNNTNGDAYLAEDTGHVHVYDGTNFVDIGIWAGIPSATDAQIDALFED